MNYGSFRIFKNSSKGQSQIITHSLIILFSVSLIVLVATSMKNIENQYENFTGDLQVDDICSIMKSSIERIYNPVSQNISVNRTEEMGYNIINLPQKIGSGYYHINLYNNTIEIETSEIVHTCEAGINATFSGKSSGGRTKIKWLYGNGTNSIVIENA